MKKNAAELSASFEGEEYFKHKCVLKKCKYLLNVVLILGKKVAFLTTYDLISQKVTSFSKKSPKKLGKLLQTKLNVFFFTSKIKKQKRSQRERSKTIIIQQAQQCS